MRQLLLVRWPPETQQTSSHKRQRYAEAILKYEAVLASNRNSACSFFNIATCKLFTQSIDETVPLIEQAIQLSPRDPFALGCWYQTIGLVHLLQSRTVEAIIWLARASNHTSARSLTRGQLSPAAFSVPASPIGNGEDLETATAPRVVLDAV